MEELDNRRKTGNLKIISLARKLKSEFVKIKETVIRFSRARIIRKINWKGAQLTRLMIVVCASGVAFSNISGSYYSFWNGWEANESDSILMADFDSRSPKVFHSLALAPIADASESISKEEMERLRKEGEKATVMGQALVGITNPTPQEFADSGDDVFVYTVTEGDTLGSIAVKYNITVNTIKWANGLEDADKIHPGDQIFVLPVTGVKHVVKSGDNVDSLALKYKAKTEDIIAFNSLPANGELKIGEEIVIPDGKIEETSPEKPSQPSINQPSTGIAQTPSTGSDTGRRFNKQYYSSSAHRFPWGWCTWYVASKRHVPWGGNAGTWLYHAKAYGANVGKAPRPGAIMVTGESRYGHVAIVENVKGDSFTVSEMNYKGFGVVSKRTINSKSGLVRGFIY